MKIIIPLPPALILDIKKEVAKKLIDKFNKEYKEGTGSIRNALTWQQNEGKIYVLKGMDIIAII